MKNINNILDKRSALNESGQLRHDSSLDHLREYTKYYENLALYSAGAISLSITFIGFVISDKTIHFGAILAVQRFPVIYILFASWIFFLVAFISSLLVRKEQSLRIYAFYTANNSKIFQDYIEARLELFKGDLSRIKFEGTLDENISLEMKNLVIVQEAHQFNKKVEKDYENRSRLLRNVAEFTVFFGLVLLVIFAIVSTNHLIN